MYFTDDKKLQRFEREMKIVPNFERKEVWEYTDSCNECKNYECKLESCMEAHCPYLKRKIRSNSIVTRDLVETFLLDHPYIPFLDSELEQLLCFDTEIDAEKFCNEKSAIFIVMPEEDPGKFFMVSLIIQQLYREILAVADENGGKLKNRCVFYCDEFGTLPKIESAEMMFSASRSRRLQIVPIIQSFAQLEKNYGKEGADVIIDNTQLTIFGGFAPNSTSAETLSKALGSRTVMSGSVSRSKDNPSQSVQMIERPLMTSDELKNLPKG